MLIHLYQLHSIAISRDLKKFFNKNLSNVIEFWDCSDSIKWSPHLLVDKETKHLKIDLTFLSKSSWESSKKEKCDSLVQKWQMIFQALNFKGRNFLELTDNNNILIHPIYTKRGV